MADPLRVIDEIRTDPALTALRPEQAKAVVQALITVVWADRSFDSREETELEQMMFELPWWEGKPAALREFTRQAIDRVRDTASDEAAVREVLEEVAAALPEPAVRDKVYAMSARIAWADNQLVPAERRILTWMAGTFRIDPDRAAQLLFSATR